MSSALEHLDATQTCSYVMVSQLNWVSKLPPTKASRCYLKIIIHLVGAKAFAFVPLSFFFSIRLGTTYFVETEDFLQKVL